jgi:hypothetical protein
MNYIAAVILLVVIAIGMLAMYLHDKRNGRM